MTPLASRRIRMQQFRLFAFFLILLGLRSMSLLEIQHRLPPKPLLITQERLKLDFSCAFFLLDQFQDFLYIKEALMVLSTSLTLLPI